MKLKTGLAAALLCGASFCSTAFGGYTQMYVFGDSLSDTGNVQTLYSASPLIPGVPQVPAPATNTIGGPGYYQGRASNGLLYADFMAQRLALGAQSLASLQGGSNYAFAGARTHYQIFDPTLSQYLGLTQQAGAYLGANPAADSDALYVVFGGANNLQDLLRGQDAFGNPPQSLGQTVSDLENILVSLHAAGARNFLVPNAPNIGLVPRVTELGPAAVAGATALSVGFNTMLEAMLNDLEFEVHRLDTYNLFNDVIANATAYGFSNTTDRCYTGDDLTFTGGGSVCADPATYVFWDGIHPTYGVHRILADAMLHAVGVPEPDVVALLCLALIATVWIRRPRNKIKGAVEETLSRLQ